MATADPPRSDHRSKPGPVPGLLGRALAWCYEAGLNARNRRFDRGTGITRFDRPVISIGNLSVGGTGKTPMVMHLTRLLLAAGRRPCIAMRGYKSGPGRPSDEAETYRQSLPGIPIIARPDRAAGLRELFSTAEGRAIDSILLDDGFQHRQIARDLDLVLIDATRPPFDGRLLPAGWLRERPSALARAGGVIITHAGAVPDSAVDSISAEVRAAGSKVLAACDHQWSGLDVSTRGEDSAQPTDWLRGRRVFAICAIGNPGLFLESARAASGPLAGSLALRDHDHYTDRTVARLLEQVRAARADVILTTEKDWAKLRAREWDLPVARPRLALRFLSGEQALADLVLRTVAGPPARAST